MKRTIVLFVYVLLIFFIGCQKEKISEPLINVSPETPLLVDSTLHIDTVRAGNLTVYHIDKFNTTIVKIPRISDYYFYENPNRTLEQVGKDSTYSLVVNTSYFDQIYIHPFTGNHYRHAGYLRIKDSVYANLKHDKQLSRLFAYNFTTNTADYFNYTQLDKAAGYDLVVQTGPQLIRNSKIDTISINSSINGKRLAPRTAFASVNGKEFYVITSLGKKPPNGGVLLYDLALLLQTCGIFRKQFDIINFDGGPSTRLYIKDCPRYSINSRQIAPVILCVK
ncbi:MAG: phosphodiester glycosidase family protein [Bacteroidota bacterium]